MRVRGLAVALASALLAVAAPSVALAATDPTVALYVESPAGGDLNRAQYYETDANVLVSAPADHTTVYVSGGNLNDNVGVSVYAPQGQTLTTGTFVAGSDPAGWRVAVYANGGVKCSDFGGTITVADLAWAGDGSIDVFDADVAYACPGKPTTTAAVRFHSSRAIEGIDTTLPHEDVADGAVTALSDLVYRNLGTSPVTVGAVTLSADDTPSTATPLSEWTLVGETCTSAPVAAGGTCVVHLQVHPTANGARRVVVAIADSTPQTTHQRMVSVLSKDAPEAPQALGADLWPDHVRLLWWNPSNIDPGTSADGVRVLRGTSPDAMTVIADLPPDSLRYEDPDVTEGIRYYRVERYNTAGTATLPAIRIGIGKGAVSNLAVVQLAHHLVVRWEAPTTLYIQAQLTEYQVYIGTTSSNLTLAATLAVPLGGPSYYRLPNLAPGTRRYARVIALYGNNNPGPASPVVSGAAQTSQITYTTGEYTGYGQIYEMPTAGGPAVPILGVANLDGIGQPVASPSGRTFAFAARQRNSLQGGIYLQYVGSTAHTLITPSSITSARDPAWSRDGRFIVFTTRDKNNHSYLAVLNVATHAVSAIPNSADLETPAYLTPTSFVAHHYGYVVNDFVKITAAGVRSSIPGTGYGKLASVSPDGKKMAFTVQAQDGEADLLKVMTFGGGTITTVRPVGYLSAPSWTPDSTSVFLSAWRQYGVDPYADVYRINVVTNTLTTLSATADVMEETAILNQPDYTAPTVKITAPTATSTTATSVKVAWSAYDLQAGVTSSDVRYRRAYGSGALGSYVSPTGWTGTTVTYKTLSVVKGYRYCFSVRSRDRVANLSAWTAERCIRAA